MVSEVLPVEYFGMLSTFCNYVADNPDSILHYFLIGRAQSIDDGVSC